METKAIKKRKIIDIPEDTFKRLSMRAAAEGKNLKSFIENLLTVEANSMTDEDIYRELLKTEPEGKEPATKEEEKDFRNWLGV